MMSSWGGGDLSFFATGGYVERQRLTWSELDALVDELAQRVCDTSFDATLLSGVPRGGWIVGGLLGQRLNLSQTAAINAEIRDGMSAVGVPPDSRLKGARIIVIEDSILSGRKLSSAASLLREQGARVLTAAIFASADAVFVPDIYVQKNTSTPLMPWE